VTDNGLRPALLLFDTPSVQRDALDRFKDSPAGDRSGGHLGRSTPNVSTRDTALCFAWEARVVRVILVDGQGRTPAVFLLSAISDRKT